MYCCSINFRIRMRMTIENGKYWWVTGFVRLSTSVTHRWYRRCSTSTYVNMPRAQSCDIIVKIYVRAISKTHRIFTHWKKSLWETECNRAEERKPVTATDTNRSFGKWLRLCEGDKSSYGQLWHKDTLLTNRICVVHFPILIALRIFRTHFMGFFYFSSYFCCGGIVNLPRWWLRWCNRRASRYAICKLNSQKESVRPDPTVR